MPKPTFERISPGLVAINHKGNRHLITVDKNGNLSQNAAIARLLDLGRGDRQGRRRNAFVDINVEADTIAPAKPKTEEDRLLQYAWWLYPNESDFATIDTPDAEWVPPKDERQRVAVGIIATQKERDAILEILNQNFTNAERRKMRGLVIEVKRSAGRGVAGFYRRANMFAARGNLRGRSKPFDQIVIGKDWLFRRPDTGGPRKGNPLVDDVVTHEVIHFLRARDQQTRSGFTARPKNAPLFGDDSDIEEAFTDAETIARIRMGPHNKEAGYYHNIKRMPEGVTAPRQAQIHDKELLMGVRKNGIPRVRPGALLYELTRTSAGAAPSSRPEDELREIGYRGRDLNRMLKDREHVTRKMFKGQKGRNAIKSVGDQFPHLALSRAQIKGRVEAIDTYWAHKSRTGTTHTHIYSPKANLHRDDAIRIAGEGSGTLNEFRDSKRVRVRNPRVRM